MAFTPLNKDAVTELDVLWITASLGCDGDRTAMTAATRPSIEDTVLGQIPWIPKVTLHVDTNAAGAQNIYFSTLLNQTCTTSTGTGGCAVQTTQAAP
jgi:hypothetical protein